MDHPDWTFAQIAKWISDEWKKIDADEKDELQKEAEEMNELGIRKLPRDDDHGGPNPEKDTTDEDSDFEEGYRKKAKPIMMKIKKEKGEGGDDGKDDDGGSDESDWEPEAELSVSQRESRSGRQRKRPSFFQEFESQENNLDHILQEFEETQAKEFGKPRQPKPEKPPSERKPRKRKPKVQEVEIEEQVETEVLRSGRKRKVRRVMTNFMDEEDDDVDAGGRGASSDDDDFEPPPEEEVHLLEKKDDEIEESDEMDEFDDDDEEDYDDIAGPKRDHALPIKKRGRPKKILTDAEIEEATRAALGTVPVIEITPVPRKEGEAASKKDDVVVAKEGRETSKEGDVSTTASADGDNPMNEDEAESESTNEEPAKEPEAFRPFFVNESLEEETEKTAEVEAGGGEDCNPLEDGAENPLGEDDNARNPLDDDPLDAEPLPAVTANPLGLDYGSGSDDSNSKSESGTSEPSQSQVPMNEEDALLTAVSCDDAAEEPMDNADNPLEGNPLEKPGENPLGDSERLPGVALANHSQEMSEEDLLTGPAHNLDDSQYKADYADPNLDDIFK